MKCDLSNKKDGYIHNQGIQNYIKSKYQYIP